jgi:outer membrane lipoprotein-sorting protein
MQANQDEVLDAAVGALRRMAREAKMPEDLLAGIAARGPRQSESPVAVRTFRFRGRKWLTPLLRCAAAAVLILLVWQAIDQLGLFRPALAFADVSKRVRQTHTVFFRSTVTIEGQKPFVMHYTLAEPGRLRIHASAPANSIVIFDEAASAGLLLLPDQKKAIALSAAADVPKETVSMIAWYRSLRQAQDQAVDDLGPRQLGDKATFGFRVKKPKQDLGQSTEFNVWVDRKTSLPVQVETTLSVQGIEGQVVLDEFAFDKDLPGGLFSLTPPPGYTVTAKTEFTMPAEQDLVFVLQMSAKQNGGVFPDDLDVKTLQKVFANEPRSKTAPGGPDFAAGLRFTNGLMFIDQRQADGDWRYQGKGVKLGDADRLICAWRKKADREWRAIFGDLLIRNLPAVDAFGKK